MRWDVVETSGGRCSALMTCSTVRPAPEIQYMRAKALRHFFEVSDPKETGIAKLFEEKNLN